jgi:phage virion morphogenesis protein
VTTLTLALRDLPGWTEGLARRLERLGLARPLQTVAFYLANQARLCFDEQRSPDGVPWAPFNRTPSARRGGTGAKLLRNTGVLMASLAGKGSGHVEDVGASSLVWGTAVPYAGFQNDGTRTIPARPFLGVTDDMKETVSKILLDYVKRMIGVG